MFCKFLGQFAQGKIEKADSIPQTYADSSFTVQVIKNVLKLSFQYDIFPVNCNDVLLILNYWVDWKRFSLQIMQGYEQFRKKTVNCPSLVIPASQKLSLLQDFQYNTAFCNLKTYLLTAIALLELKGSNGWEHALFWWRSVKPEFAQLTELSDNLITLFLWNACKKQFSDICNGRKLGRCATEGYVLCTGDIQCHIPDKKHRCARTPCIDVRNVILGINICLCVFLLTSWAYRMKRCFDFFFFFFSCNSVCYRNNMENVSSND